MTRDNNNSQPFRFVNVVGGFSGPLQFIRQSASRYQLLVISNGGTKRLALGSLFSPACWLTKGLWSSGFGGQTERIAAGRDVKDSDRSLIEIGLPAYRHLTRLPRPWSGHYGRIVSTSEQDGREMTLKHAVMRYGVEPQN